MEHESEETRARGKDMKWERFDRLIEDALLEDGARQDVTTGALIDPRLTCEADVVVNEEGTVCGLPLVERVGEVFDARLALEGLSEDGTHVRKGTVVARLSGPAASVLSVERTALNFLQRLSGIATLTRRFVEAVEGTGAKILDTRKTTPGWRLLEKYAVRCGGGLNHRMGLSDQVLIKDNHLALRRRQQSALGSRQPAAGGMAEAVGAARRAAKGLKVEIEVGNLEELAEALPAEPDVIMLDNMTPGEVRRAAEMIQADRSASASRKRPLLEASGAINLQNVRAYAEAGADHISVGALTHSAPALDISLEMR